MSSRHSYALAPEYDADEEAIARLYERLLDDPDLLTKMRETRPREFDNLVYETAETIYADSGD